MLLPNTLLGEKGSTVAATASKHYSSDRQYTSTSYLNPPLPVPN